MEKNKTEIEDEFNFAKHCLINHFIYNTRKEITSFSVGVLNEEVSLKLKGYFINYFEKIEIFKDKNGFNQDKWNISFYKHKNNNEKNFIDKKIKNIIKELKFIKRYDCHAEMVCKDSICSIFEKRSEEGNYIKCEDLKKIINKYR